MTERTKMTHPNRRAVLTAAAATGAALATAPFAEATPPLRAEQPGRHGADLILHNGRIATMDRKNPMASAVAIRGGLIDEIFDAEAL